MSNCAQIFYSLRGLEVLASGTIGKLFKSHTERKIVCLSCPILSLVDVLISDRLRGL